MSGAAAEVGWETTVDGVSALPVELVDPPTWERLPEHGKIRLAMPEWNRDSVLDDRVAHVLEGLEAGEDLPAIVDRLEREDAYPSRSSAHRNARNIVLGLAGQGHVEIHLPPVPETFAGRYERVRELGRGAVGVAWLCRETETGERVVVKHAWNWSGPLDRRDENLRREARLAERLDHPGVVSLVDRVEHEGRFHLVREYVDGVDLGERVLTDGALPAPERRDVARQLADVLAHLHERSVLCMDVKPGNLLREPGGRLVLADLGHCRRVEDPPVGLERVPGTRGYLGPEVFEEHRAGVPNDVYGLAKSYEFLTTAYPPTQGEDRDVVLERMRERGDPAPDELAFVETCLARPPGRRPSPQEAVGHLAAGQASSSAEGGRTSTSS